MSDLPTCKTCPHWKLDEQQSIKDADIRRCNRTEMFWDATEWGDDHEGFKRRLTDEAKDFRMFTQDGSDYFASLYTRDDHFCGEHPHFKKDA
jgi:hypothetical protein